MEKKLSQCLTLCKKSFSFKISLNQDKDPLISSLVFDSRSIKKGSLFFALPGIHVHGNTFVEEAIGAGALAVLYEGNLGERAVAAAKKFGTVLIYTPDTRFAMSPIAAAFYDYPGKKLGIFGVTGTEGKSTTVFLIWQFLRFLGKKAGFISTVQYSLGEEAVNNPEHQTTPEAPIIQEKLFAMVAAGCEYAVIEASSHGLSVRTNRLGDVPFDAAAMMNVTHEHLEFHGTYDQYKSDKANLFRNLTAHDHIKTIAGVKCRLNPIGTVKASDPAAAYFSQAAANCPVAAFSSGGEQGDINPLFSAVYRAKNINEDKDGLTFTLSLSGVQKSFVPPLRINLPGAFNADNTLASIILVSGITGASIESLIPLAAKLVPVRGRMTIIDEGQPFEVLVDYAHTPSSFTTIFPPLRQRISLGGGRIISLFGSGGERDTQKRPLQGRIARQYSDILVLADEDPRGENSMELLEMIADGCSDMVRNENLFLIPDRPAAIRKAFSLAKKGDLVLLLGKAHENSIIYKDYTMPYDEINEAKKALKEMGFEKSNITGDKT